MKWVIRIQYWLFTIRVPVGLAMSWPKLWIPPVVTSDVPGKRFTMHAKKLGSIRRGSPIYFRGIQVGEIADDWGWTTTVE